MAGGPSQAYAAALPIAAAPPPYGAPRPMPAPYGPPPPLSPPMYAQAMPPGPYSGYPQHPGGPPTSPVQGMPPPGVQRFDMGGLAARDEAIRRIVWIAVLAIGTILGVVLATQL